MELIRAAPAEADLALGFGFLEKLDPLLHFVGKFDGDEESHDRASLCYAAVRSFKSPGFLRTALRPAATSAARVTRFCLAKASARSSRPRSTLREMTLEPRPIGGRPIFFLALAQSLRSAALSGRNVLTDWGSSNSFQT